MKTIEKKEKRLNYNYGNHLQSRHLQTLGKDLADLNLYLIMERADSKLMMPKSKVFAELDKYFICGGGADCLARIKGEI
ncbi:Uncharacterised protein [uncultured archaeon]|nr:Uncharacterised protein [uncultured archaeon]